jgi:hypothetical protein
MKARELISNASYGPDTLAVLFKAFDDAWAHLAPRVGSDALAVEAARLKLANIVLSLAGRNGKNAEELKTAALRIMELDLRT